VATPKSAVHKVGSWTTVDLQASYEWIYDSSEEGGGLAMDGKNGTAPHSTGLNAWQRLLNRTKLTVGVLNVGDSEPPFANVEDGYDSLTSDPYGRFIYASIRKKFW
jgi:outer membrane receptor protein involved in Fe transport